MMIADEENILALVFSSTKTDEEAEDREEIIETKAEIQNNICVATN